MLALEPEHAVLALEDGGAAAGVAAIERAGGKRPTAAAAICSRTLFHADADLGHPGLHVELEHLHGGCGSRGALGVRGLRRQLFQHVDGNRHNRIGHLEHAGEPVRAIGSVVAFPRERAVGFRNAGGIEDGLVDVDGGAGESGRQSFETTADQAGGGIRVRETSTRSASAWHRAALHEDRSTGAVPPARYSGVAERAARGRRSFRSPTGVRPCLISPAKAQSPR